MKAVDLLFLLNDLIDQAGGDVEIVARDIDGHLKPVIGVGRACLIHHHIAAPMLGCNADGGTWTIDVGHTP